jgi:Skp family chaperone for outer membrane proteins
MKRLAAAAATLAVLALASTAVRSQDAPPPTRVGFVDVERCVGEWKKRDEVRKALKAKSDALAARFRQDRTRIEEKEARLATLNETSDDFVLLSREIDGDRFLLKRDTEFERMRLELQERRDVWLLYKAVVTEARGVAEAKGLACVLDSAPLTAEMDKAKDPLSHVPKRTVVWSDPRLDLTAEVLESLNAQMPK